MQHLGTWLGGHGGDRLTLGLNELRVIKVGTDLSGSYSAPFTHAFSCTQVVLLCIFATRYNATLQEEDSRPMQRSEQYLPSTT